MKPKILLIGAGHINLKILRDFSKKTPINCDLILIHPTDTVFYSGLIPAVISGRLAKKDAEIDLSVLTRRAGGRLVLASLVEIDPKNQSVLLSDDRRLFYDIVSLNPGSVPVFEYACARCCGVKPFNRLLDAIMAFRVHQSARVEPSRIAIVGGGAAGCELAFALRAVQSQEVPDEITIYESRDRLLPGFEGRDYCVRSALEQREIQVETGREVVRAEARGDRISITLIGGGLSDADLVLIATPGRPPAWLASSGLLCASDGSILVDDTLRSLSHPSVFAAGDAATVHGMIHPRSGVYAIRQAAIVAHNLRALITGRPMRRYRAQRRSLAIIATGDGRGIGLWGRYAGESRGWAWVKSWLDTRYMRLNNQS